MDDADLRAACFAALDVLCAKHGLDVPYKRGLDHGFAFRGTRVPFLNYQRGIYRSAVQRGPAALSLNTSYRSPYEDEPTVDGFRYAYRAGVIDQPDNRALRAAHALSVPLVYFVGTRPGWYRPEWPVYVTGDDIERRYAVRETRVRLHQTRFRARVLPAYANRCTVCRLKGNALARCRPHHRRRRSSWRADHLERAQPLLDSPPCTGRRPDRSLTGLRCRGHPRLRDDEDGPMLDVLKGAHGAAILVPRQREWQPDRALLAVRFERFRTAG